MKSMYVSLAVASALVAGCTSDSTGNRAPVNQAPSITAIADQSAIANMPHQAIAFAINDEDVGSLSVAAASDRQQVVADSGLTLGGSGSDRTITVTPVIDTVGDAFITIMVTDRQGLSASSSFRLTVSAEPRSMQQFARETFAESADGEPAFINAIDFDQDAEADDFTDLLAQ